MISQRKDTVIGSASDELRLLDFTSLQMSAMNTLLKSTNRGEFTSVRTGLQGGVILARIFSFFSTKYDEKSWHASGLLGAETFVLYLVGNRLF